MARFRGSPITDGTWLTPFLIGQRDCQLSGPLRSVNILPHRITRENSFPDSFVGVQRRCRVENHLFGVHSRETHSAVYSCSRTLASYPPTALLATSRVIRLIRELNSSRARLSRELGSRLHRGNCSKLKLVCLAPLGLSPSGPRTAARPSILGRNISLFEPSKNTEDSRANVLVNLRAPLDVTRHCVYEISASRLLLSLLGGCRVCSPVTVVPKISSIRVPIRRFGELGKQIVPSELCYHANEFESATNNVALRRNMHLGLERNHSSRITGRHSVLPYLSFLLTRSSPLSRVNR